MSKRGKTNNRIFFSLKKGCAIKVKTGTTLVCLPAVSLLWLRRQKPRSKQREDNVKQKGLSQENWFPVKLTGSLKNFFQNLQFREANHLESEAVFVKRRGKAKTKHQKKKKKTWYVWTRSKVTAVLGGTWT